MIRRFKKGGFYISLQDSTDPASQFRGLLTSAGLAVRKCEAVQFSFAFANQNELLSALEAVNPWVGRLPRERRPEFLRDCLACLLQLQLGPARRGKVEASYSLMVAHVRK